MVLFAYDLENLKHKNLFVTVRNYKEESAHCSSTDRFRCRTSEIHFCKRVRTWPSCKSRRLICWNKNIQTKKKAEEHPGQLTSQILCTEKMDGLQESNKSSYFTCSRTKENYQNTCEQLHTFLNPKINYNLEKIVDSKKLPGTKISRSGSQHKGVLGDKKFHMWKLFVLL